MNIELMQLEYYLVSTDWYIVRKAETGAAIPQEVLDARAAARIRISEIRDEE